MKLLSLVICLIAPVYPVYSLIGDGDFSNPLLFAIGLVFIAIHLLPFLYMYLRIPHVEMPLGLKFYWFVAIIAVAALGNFFYFEWALAKQQPDYRPDAQEAVMYFVIPMYQTAVAFAACFLRSVAANKLGWISGEKINCGIFSLRPRT